MQLPQTMPVQPNNRFDGSMSIPSPTTSEQNRVPADGQTCILDGSGEVIWTNESWRRNGSPLPIALTIGDNYCTACSENRSSIADARNLEAALEHLLDSTTEYFDLEIACIATEANGPGRHYRCLIRAQVIAVDGNRCVMLSHEDVSEARLANAALHASEERYRQFLEAAPDPVFLLSGSPEDSGRILDANTKAVESHGYTRDEMLTMSIGDLDVREDAQLVKQQITALLEKGSITFQAMYRRRDGSEFPVEVSARTATIDGKPCIVSFNRDISERREFEDALRENKLRIDLAAKASQVGFWHWDLCTNSVIFSAEWKAQIGYEPHEIECEFEEWRSRVHPDDLEAAMLAVNNHIEGLSAEYRTEFRLQHKDGSYRWIYVRGAINHDDAGKPVRFVGCHVDITANKQAEEERELLTQRLSQLQRIEAMGTLAGGIAHDFNNILSIIGGNVELAMMATDDPPLVESLTEIHKASKRAGSLVRQVLSFSREEAPERRQVELGPIVEEAARLVRSTTPQRITIEGNIDAGVPIVFADPEQLHQVLVNLGTNAWHAIGDGAGHVTFRLTSGSIPEHLARPPGTMADTT
ncbi:MAG: PAS domain S-box-containing protein, partial [Planctomycetota bacterium]